MKEAEKDVITHKLEKINEIDGVIGDERSLDIDIMWHEYKQARHHAEDDLIVIQAR